MGYVRYQLLRDECDRKTLIRVCTLPLFIKEAQIEEVMMGEQYHGGEGTGRLVKVKFMLTKRDASGRSQFSENELQRD